MSIERIAFKEIYQHVFYLTILAIFSSHLNGDLVSLVGKCSFDNVPIVFKVPECVTSCQFPCPSISMYANFQYINLPVHQFSDIGKFSSEVTQFFDVISCPCRLSSLSIFTNELYSSTHTFASARESGLGKTVNDAYKTILYQQ